MSNYTRNFVLLKEDQAGFSVKDKPPSGKCILETRGEFGKIIVDVFDLKPNITYKIFLISCENGVSYGVKMGYISVLQNGSGQFKAEFDPCNICGMDIHISRINVVAIVAEVGDFETLNSPLVGFVSEPVRWKKTFVDVFANRVKTAEVKPQLVFESEKISEKAKKIEKKIEMFQEPLAQAECVIEQAPVIEEETKTEDSPVKEDDKKVAHDRFRAVAKQFLCELEELENFSLPWGDHAKFSRKSDNKTEKPEEVAMIFANNEKIEPFDGENAGEEWVKVSIEQLSSAFSVLEDFCCDPFVFSSYCQYKHMIFGQIYGDHNREDANKFYVGVPARFESTFKNAAKLLGFSAFKPIHSGKAKDGEQGYWIVDIEI